LQQFAAKGKVTGILDERMAKYPNPNRHLAGRKPFWLPASSFYFLVTGFAAASFFLVIGVVHENGREPEIVAAGLVASSVLVAGVVLREVVMRNAREKRLIQQKRLEKNLMMFPVTNSERDAKKFTLEKNTAAIEMIKSKAEAATVFGQIASGHREVFQLCEEYRRIVAHEIRHIHPNSPRLQALLKGNEFALRTHKYHLLRWAELESKSFASQARDAIQPSQRVENALHAKSVLLRALEQYPDEPDLKDSETLLDELISTYRISQFIADAENARAGGDAGRANEIIHEGFGYLDASDLQTSNQELLAHLKKELESHNT
jgi:hypothetical protein